MLDLMKSPENVVAVRLSGTLTVEDVERIKSEFERKLEQDGKIGVVIDFTAFEDATPDAIMADARWEISQLGNIGRFARIAMISDKQWIRFFANGADRLLPGVAIRVFAPGEEGAAMAFASELKAGTPARSPGIRLLESDRPDLFAFEIDGPITSEGMEAVTRPLEAAFGKGGKIDLLARMTDFEGFDPAILTQHSFISMKLGGLSHVRRYAIVGAAGWMEAIIKSMAPLTPVEIRTFGLAEEAAAWAWLRS